ncbi:MAG: low molecular weight protein arginine phosphatase [Candidatus Omnitrophota bacterium]
MRPVKKILVVCSGNSCRSPMAEAFLKKYLSADDGYEILSAGTLGFDGLPATKEAIAVMKEENLDISGYVSSALKKEMIENADIVFAMSKIHKDYILGKVPAAKDKVFLLKEYAEIDEDDKNISDPIGRPTDFYREVKDQIRKAVEEIVIRIKDEG